MPELPEVETTCRGIAPHIVGRRIQKMSIYNGRLRWPVPESLPRRVEGEIINGVSRRAKYVLIHIDQGDILVHLGMSGALRVLPGGVELRKHDHVDLLLDSTKSLRFHDPRRFGSWLWQERGKVHPLLAHLGPEPLSDQFEGDYLWRLSRHRSTAVKAFLMDQNTVVGVGNIYAAEALFRAGIHPKCPVKRVSRARYVVLCEATRDILSRAIECGGTTLKDFLQPNGQPGYFEQSLWVYGREGHDCRVCGHIIKAQRIAQRNSFWCPQCQSM